MEAAVKAFREASIPLDVHKRVTRAGDVLPCIVAGARWDAVVVALAGDELGRPRWAFVWGQPDERAPVTDVTVTDIPAWDAGELVRRVANVLDVAAVAWAGREAG
ncbi:hypothetical protein J0910_24115 [Nocardiopsis sp. CNT-189]|uniref:hypothetical protein n=1 Tax=Nocardiopsis oceanisediminis TaxID=2816862 RepID=UPI003B36DEFC